MKRIYTLLIGLLFVVLLTGCAAETEDIVQVVPGAEVTEQLTEPEGAELENLPPSDNVNTQPDVLSKEQCEAQGGEQIGCFTTTGQLCSLPTPDAGKSCTTSSECSEECVAPPNCEELPNPQGTCAARTGLVCNGVAIFHNGCAGTVIA